MKVLAYITGFVGLSISAVLSAVEKIATLEGWQQQ